MKNSYIDSAHRMSNERIGKRNRKEKKMAKATPMTKEDIEARSAKAAVETDVVVPPARRGRVALKDMTEEQRKEYEARKAERQAEKEKEAKLKQEAERLQRLQATNSIVKVTRDRHPDLFEQLDKMSAVSGKSIQEIFSDAVDHLDLKAAARAAREERILALQVELEALESIDDDD